MLGSITPLGERGRNSRWSLTVGAFVAGSVAGGLGIGAVAGSVGRLGLPDMGGGFGPALLAGLIAIGVAFDARLMGLRLPTVRRQVNEEWLGRYRGWVYGVGFGFQLGLGVVTIVTTAAVYVAFAAAVLSRSALIGAVIGGTFGLSRAGTILAAAPVHHPHGLLRLDARLRRWDRPSRRLVIALEFVLAGVAVIAALTMA
jgi:hypothetical protein